jgi:hypothetical protein
VSDCDVCGIVHDPDVHRAVLSVRRWLKVRVERILAPLPNPCEPGFRPEAGMTVAALRESRPRGALRGARRRGDDRR